MDMLYLIVRIAGQRVALPAEHVESVVEIEAVTPVPLAARHVAGLAALRSRVLTMIDTRAALELGTAPPDARQAVIVTVDNHLYGLLVEQVDDVVRLPAATAGVRAALAPGWRRAMRGVVEMDGDVLLLLDPAALVAGAPALAA